MSESKAMNVMLDAYENAIVRPHKEPEMPLYHCQQCGKQLIMWEDEIIQHKGILYCEPDCFLWAMGAERWDRDA